MRPKSLKHYLKMVFEKVYLFNFRKFLMVYIYKRKITTFFKWLILHYGLSCN